MTATPHVEDDWLERLSELQRRDDPRVAEAALRFMGNLRVGPWPSQEADSDWPCIEFARKPNKDGYPQFPVPELDIYLAHHFGWRLFREDEVPDGHHLHHLCGNRRCVIHLEAKLAKEHIADHNRARRRPKVIDFYAEERDGTTFKVYVLEEAVRREGDDARKPRRTDSRPKSKRSPRERTRRPGKALARNRRRRHVRREAKRRPEGGNLI